MVWSGSKSADVRRHICTSLDEIREPLASASISSSHEQNSRSLESETELRLSKGAIVASCNAGHCSTASGVAWRRGRSDQSDLGTGLIQNGGEDGVQSVCGVAAHYTSEGDQLRGRGDISRVRF